MRLFNQLITYMCIPNSGVPDLKQAHNWCDLIILSLTLSYTVLPNEAEMLFKNNL